MSKRRKEHSTHHAHEVHHTEHTRSPESLAKEIARWVALIALFTIAATPLIVSNSLFFPFITGKAYFFRACVEVAFCAWGVLALLDKAYRPRYSIVGAIVLGFVAWMFLADTLAINVGKAFWSNSERMEGWILLAHLLAFFVAAGGVLRVEKAWRAWFLAVLGVSLLLLMHGFLQLTGALPIHQGQTRIDASFGNSAYFAIYLLFNTFVAGWLALTESRPWLKWSLVLLAGIEAIFIIFTQTRGTVLGLVGGLFIAAVLTAFFSKGRPRKVAIGSLLALLVIVGADYSLRNTELARTSDFWNRLTHFSVSDGHARFMIWHMAWQGFVDRPIVGWGQEGFNYVFDKYYDPGMYAQEPWFDRAHNAFIDWLTAGGLPAFLLYIGLFVSAIYVLWRSELSIAEKIALTCALLGYACHNLFVFDNLFSYVYFFAILALIDAQVGRPIRFFERMEEVDPDTGLAVAVPAAAALMIGGVLWLNAPGIRADNELVRAISTQPAGMAGNLALFQGLVAHPSFISQEIAEQLANTAFSISQSQDIPQDLKNQVTALAVKAMQEEVKKHPLDTREHLELMIAYRAAGDLASAIKEIETALELSPSKEQVWVEAGATYLDLGDVQKARDAFAKAYELGPQFTDLANTAAAGEFLVGNATEGRKILFDAYGTTTVSNDFLGIAYYRSGNYQDLIKMWQLRVGQQSVSVTTYFNLASAYYIAGEHAEAVKVLERALILFPDSADQIKAALTDLSTRTSAP